MLQLPLATGQSAADLPQRMRSSKLAEQHGDVLPPTTEALCTPFGLMFFYCCNCSREWNLSKQSKNIRPNGVQRASVVGGNSSPCCSASLDERIRCGRSAADWPVARGS